MRLILLTILSAVLCSCSDDHEEPVVDSSVVIEEYEPRVLNVLRKDSLRILDIGNSYTDDATAMLAQVAEACGVDVSTVGIYTAVRGWGSFKSWLDCYNDKDDQAYHTHKICGDLKANVRIGSFEAGKGEAFREILEKNVWDVIILHQVSAYAPYYSEWFGYSYGGYLPEFLSLIKACQPQALIGFYVVHSYWSGFASNTERSSRARWQLAANSIDNLANDGLCDIVIPYGTAIENLRASSLNNEYDLTRDGTHLELGLARYAAACCYYESILAPRYGVSMQGQSFHWDGPQMESAYPIVNLVDSTIKMGQRAAALAVADWRHCCNPEVTSGR